LAAVTAAASFGLGDATKIFLDELPDVAAEIAFFEPLSHAQGGLVELGINGDGSADDFFGLACFAFVALLPDSGLWCFRHVLLGFGFLLPTDRKLSK
jgi:hypothetical protein